MHHFFVVAHNNVKECQAGGCFLLPTVCCGWRQIQRLNWISFFFFPSSFYYPESFVRSCEQVEREDVREGFINVPPPPPADLASWGKGKKRRGGEKPRQDVLEMRSPDCLTLTRDNKTEKRRKNSVGGLVFTHFSKTNRGGQFWQLFPPFCGDVMLCLQY